MSLRLGWLWACSALLFGRCSSSDIPQLAIQLNDSVHYHYPSIVGDHQNGFLLVDSAVQFVVKKGPWTETREFSNLTTSLLCWGQFYSDSSSRVVHIEGIDNPVHLRLARSVHEDQKNKMVGSVVVGYPAEVQQIVHLGSAVFIRPGNTPYRHISVADQVQFMGTVYPEVFAANDLLQHIELEEDFDLLMEVSEQAQLGEDEMAGFILTMAYGMAQDSIDRFAANSASDQWHSRVKDQQISYLEMTDKILLTLGYRKEMQQDHEGFFSEYEFVKIAE